MTDDKPEPERKDRPRFGERAPEGWTWVPPKDAANPDGVHPAGSPGQHDAGQRHPRSQAPLGRPGPPAWDRIATTLLLVLGLFGMFLSIGILGALPQSIQVIYAQDNLGTYSPGESVPTLILAGQICQGVVWLLAAAGSILLMVRRKRAFYVPIIAGFVAAILLFVFIGVIAAGDSTLIDYYSGG